MAGGVLRYCLEPGCPEKVKRGRCEHHRLARAKRQDERRERGPRVYDRRAWKRLRARKLEADPHCELRIHCSGAPAVEVHHKDGDQWNLAWSNLVSACKSCHSSHTAREQGFARDGGSTSRAPSRAPGRWFA